MHPQQLWMQLLRFTSSCHAHSLQFMCSWALLHPPSLVCGCDRGNSYMGAGCCCCCCCWCGYKPISRENELCMSVISGLRSLCLLVDKIRLCGGCVCDGESTHALLPTWTWAPLLRLPLIGLGGVSGGYLMWRLLNEMWIWLQKSTSVQSIWTPYTPPHTSSKHKIWAPTPAFSIVFN